MYQVMIVDDEKVEREVMRLFIEQSKLEIEVSHECLSGRQALGMILKDQPDIILLDINMPGLNGLEVLDRLRLAGVGSKVIFSTAYGYFEYAQKAVQLGAYDYLLKPVSESKMIQTLARAVDELDEERAKTHQEERLQNYLNHMGNQVVSSIIGGQINDEVLYYLTLLGIGERAYGRCFYLKIPEESLENQKILSIRDALRDSLEKLGCRSLCKIKHDTLLFIVVIAEEALFKVLDEPIYQMFVHAIEHMGHGAYTLQKGIPFQDIHGVEKSFTSARLLLGDLRDDLLPDVEPEEQEMLLLLPLIKSFIEENCDKKLTLDQVADNFGYSKYYINRVFKQQYKRTIIDYHIRCRIEQAKILLAHQDISVKKISETLGYSDANYFTWCFKKVEGVSPVKYRYALKDDH